MDIRGEVMFKDVIWNLFFRKDLGFVMAKIDVDEKLAAALVDIDNLNSEIISKNDLISSLNDTISKQKEQMEEKEKEEELEEFWNNKRPKTIWLYPGRPNPSSPKTNLMVDPRIFYQYDRSLTRVSGKNSDEIALRCLKHVARNIIYTKDDKEYWQFAYETQKRGKGDCEDGAILMANMMIMSGVPYWRIRLNTGDVKGGGHAWVTYLREKDNKWYIMDWCYWYNESKDFKKTWDDAEKYFNIWGSWNTKYIYGDLPR